MKSKRGIMKRPQVIAKQNIMHRSLIVAAILGLTATLGSIAWGQAARPHTKFEAEQASQTTCTQVINDANASGGQAIVYGQGQGCQTSGDECIAEGVCGYNLVWGDEFDGTSVDTNKWQQFNHVNYGTGGREDQCYYARNNTVSGGYLSITGKRETVECSGTNPDGGNRTYYFTSGFLVANYDFNKGYIEASVKAPRGNIWWPAFWLRGGTGAPGWPDYGEVDIFELVGIQPDQVKQTFHWNCADYNADSHCQTAGQGNVHNFLTGQSGSSYCFPGISGDTQTTANFNAYNGQSTSRYIKYGLLWTSDSYTYYIDGKPTIRLSKDGILTFFRRDGSALSSRSDCRVNSSSTVAHTIDYKDRYTPAQLQSLRNSFDYNHSININLAVGGGFPRNHGYTGIETSTGYNDGNLIHAGVPGVMSVDYVRVYKMQ